MEMEIQEFAHRHRSPAGIFYPNMLNVGSVLEKMGLCKGDIQPITQEEIRGQSVPKDCERFAELYVEIKTKHQNERRRRLEAVVREVVQTGMQRVMKECDRIQWRDDHSASMLAPSRLFRPNHSVQLEQLLQKENKRLKVDYELSRKANELESHLKKKLEQACQRHKEISRTKCEFKKRSNFRGREQAGEKNKESLLARQMQKGVYHRKSQQILTTIKGLDEVSVDPSKEDSSVEATFGEIQHIIMKHINQQDFEENQKINQKVREFRINCISEKRKLAQQRVKEGLAIRQAEQKEAELLKNKVRMEKQKLGKGGYMTLERFETNPRLKSNPRHLSPSLERNPSVTLANTHSLSAFPLNEELASRETKQPESQTDELASRLKKQRLENKRKRKYANSADWLGICHENIEATMLAFRDKLLQAIAGSSAHWLDRNSPESIPHFEQMLKHLNEELHEAEMAS